MTEVVIGARVEKRNVLFDDEPATAESHYNIESRKKIRYEGRRLSSQDRV